MALLELVDVRKHFATGSALSRRRGVLKAVDGVSLSVEAGETVGLVGESGCGKSTLARCVMGLHRTTSGSIHFEGRNLTALGQRDARSLKQHLTMVFQDPQASLNPRRRVGDIVATPLQIHGLASGAEMRRKVGEILEKVGLNAAVAGRYPHEFSGGQRQRIGLARALVTGPRLVLCDEPVSALDVSIQAQILNLLRDLQADLDLTLVFIAHDLGVVRHVSDRIAVMYLGKIVELATADELFAAPTHPYTEALLAAVPIPDPSIKRPDVAPLEGDVPSPLNPPSGCRFHTRCRYADARCSAEEPALDRSGGKPHEAACHHPLTAGAVSLDK